MQAKPQAPQLAESDDTSTQPAPQSSYPTAHPQAPPLHCSPGLQALPQVPQLRLSAAVLTQRPPHSVMPLLQEALFDGPAPGAAPGPPTPSVSTVAVAPSEPGGEESSLHAVVPTRVQPHTANPTQPSCLLLCALRFMYTKRTLCRAGDPTSSATAPIPIWVPNSVGRVSGFDYQRSSHDKVPGA